MATTRKLPSGKYRCLIFIGMENGKRKYKSFTANTKKEAELKATQYVMDKEEYESDRDAVTFKTAMELYISSKEPLLSPYSITSYITIKRYLESHFTKFCEQNIFDITQKDIQCVVNEMARSLEPKTVRSRHGYIVSVLKENGYEKNIKTQLPQKKRPDNYVPTEKEVIHLLKSAKGTELEVPIMLAAFGIMRRGEICALTLDDFNGNIVHIHKNKVRDHNKDFHIKSPKHIPGTGTLNFHETVSNFV